MDAGGALMEPRPEARMGGSVARTSRGDGQTWTAGTCVRDEEQSMNWLCGVVRERGTKDDPWYFGWSKGRVPCDLLSRERLREDPFGEGNQSSALDGMSFGHATNTHIHIHSSQPAVTVDLVFKVDERR